VKEFKEFSISQPERQNILDIFRDKWICEVPKDSGLTTGGNILAFEDKRIRWLVDTFGKLEGASVLELGPFEAGHTYMLSKRGVAKIVSIEASVSSLLKCLCIKEVFGMNNVEFLLGDFNSFLEKCESKFDLILVSGVLYHMADPIKLLKHACSVANNLFLWTHYLEKEIPLVKANEGGRFGPLTTTNFENLEYEFSEQRYKYDVADDKFCGGIERTSKWLTMDSIFRALKYFGHQNLKIGPHEPNHVNGPAMSCFSQIA
jgi:hypothetical protein